ncbi:MAG TPA: hypothetical protein VIK31_08020 [Propionibacteriaceae bacterium]
MAFDEELDGRVAEVVSNRGAQEDRMPGLEGRVIVERLVGVLDEAVHGASGSATFFVDNRPDAGLFGCLADVSAAEASRAVAGTSVAAHVHHVAFAMDASAGWMAGDRTPRDWDSSWNTTTVDDESWLLLVERLHDGYGNLRAAIGSGAVDDAETFGEAVGAIAHIAYHLGSIWQKLALLRKTTARGPA